MINYKFEVEFSVDKFTKTYPHLYILKSRRQHSRIL